MSFKNAIIILTSNLGSGNILEMTAAMEGESAAAQRLAIKSLVMAQVSGQRKTPVTCYLGTFSTVTQRWAR